VKSFTEQAFDGKAWQEVQRRISGTNANKYAKPASKTRAILIQSGKLRRAVSTSLRFATFDKIEFLIDGGTIPYAKVHNDGDRAGRGAGFIMPKRRFIGDTKELRKKQVDIIVNEIDNIWK
jgi:phage gpG-like protein